MSKLRKGVQKQKKKSQQRAIPRKDIKEKLQASSEYKTRDLYLYKSALKSYGISVLLLILAIWLNGDFPPINYIKEDNNLLDQLLDGSFSLAFFFFTILSWGNALEIRGNVLEWKHIIFLLVIVVFISFPDIGNLNDDILGFFIALFGSFGILTALWYANR
ncbi:MAG: hypothetical protein ACFFCS_07310 [Candidatus Hodarchaeota archaeon]